MMSAKLRIDEEFISICQQILNEDHDLNSWASIESSDQFQTDNYCGGFDKTENEFTFSFYKENGKEFWFQLPLRDVNKVIAGSITEIEIREAEY
ncbi:hypothetical protein [Flagellimonas sp.]|uniref:hypothetical protein n=1 Tax=Flagellimonas sp. TaxID=2058762 RepID=UPI003B5C288F